ncbi:hypothetical protein Pcinc_024141, partial [Petrolisthes cinctipes]
GGGGGGGDDESVRCVVVVHVVETVVRVVVKDINDNTPFFNPSSVTAFARENGPRGEVVTRVTASDLDEAGTRHSKVRYSLQKNAVHEVTGQPLFQVESETGEVRTAVCCLDREAAPRYTLQVTATDGGGLQGTGTVLVEVGDENDNPPRLARPLWRGAVVVTTGAVTTEEEKNDPYMTTTTTTTTTKTPSSSSSSSSSPSSSSSSYSMLLNLTVSDLDLHNTFLYRVVEGSGPGWNDVGVRTEGATGVLYPLAPLTPHQVLRFQVQVTDKGETGWSDPAHVDTCWVELQVVGSSQPPPTTPSPTLPSTLTSPHYDHTYIDSHTHTSSSPHLHVHTPPPPTHDPTWPHPHAHASSRPNSHAHASSLPHPHADSSSRPHPHALQEDNKSTHPPITVLSSPPHQETEAPPNFPPSYYSLSHRPNHSCHPPPDTTTNTMCHQHRTCLNGGRCACKGEREGMWGPRCEGVSRPLPDMMVEGISLTPLPPCLPTTISFHLLLTSSPDTLLLLHSGPPLPASPNPPPPSSISSPSSSSVPIPPSPLSVVPSPKHHSATSSLPTSPHSIPPSPRSHTLPHPSSLSFPPPSPQPIPLPPNYSHAPSPPSRLSAPLPNPLSVVSSPGTFSSSVIPAIPSLRSVPPSPYSVPSSPYTPSQRPIKIPLIPQTAHLRMPITPLPVLPIPFSLHPTQDSPLKTLPASPFPSHHHAINISPLGSLPDFPSPPTPHTPQKSPQPVPPRRHEALPASPSSSNAPPVFVSVPSPFSASPMTTPTLSAPPSSLYVPLNSLFLSPSPSLVPPSPNFAPSSPLYRPPSPSPALFSPVRTKASSFSSPISVHVNSYLSQTSPRLSPHPSPPISSYLPHLTLISPILVPMYSPTLILFTPHSLTPAHSSLTPALKTLLTLNPLTSTLTSLTPALKTLLTLISVLNPLTPALKSLLTLV